MDQAIRSSATESTMSGPTTYARHHGAAWLLFGGGSVGLLASNFWHLPSAPVISVGAFTIAALAWLTLQRERPARLWFIAPAAGVLLVLLGVFVLDLRSASDPRAIAASYAASRGTGLCNSARCEGHEAGWAWAKRNDVTDPDECGGRSLSFEEGCRAYGEDAQTRLR